MGRVTVPSIRSAHAILTTSNKLFLRKFLLIAKRKIVSKFPMAINTASSAKAEQNTIPVTMEGSFEFGQDPFLGVEVFSEFVSIYLICRRDEYVFGAGEDFRCG